MDLNEVTPQALLFSLPFLTVLSMAMAIPSSSTLSPLVVPVPCPSTKSTSEILYSKSLYALPMAKDCPLDDGSMIPPLPSDEIPQPLIVA